MSLTIFLFLIFNFISVHTYSQKINQPHGTLIVGFICNDGILMAADSRSTYVYTDTTNGKKAGLPFAYIDSIKKIHEFDKWRIGVSGNIRLVEKSFVDITSDFRKSHKQNPSLIGTYHEFINYLKIKLGVTDSSILIGNEYTIAGYENGKPIILYGKPYSKDRIYRKIEMDQVQI